MRTSYDPSPYDDDWEDQPAQGPFYKWVLGAAVPAALTWYGVAVLITHEAHLGGRFPTDLFGTNAIALGVVSCSMALFLHGHYFWGNIFDQAWFAVLAKIVGLIGVIGGLGVLIVRVGVLDAR